MITRKNTLLSIGVGILISVTGLAACGKSETLNRVNEAVDLQGRFQTNASEEISIRAGGVGCVVQNLDITAAKMTIVQTAFDDGECKGKAIGRMTTEGSVSIGDELASRPNARAMDFKISKVSITPLDSNWLSIFGIDVSGDCKVEDLGVGQTREITGLNCGVLGHIPHKGDVYFTSYLLNDTELLFTRLPNESPENMGTEEHRVDRNEDLVMSYIRL